MKLSQRGLHWAAKRNYCSIISLLIEHGADVNAQDGSNRTALYLASKQDNVEAVTVIKMHNV
jgi:ankyrin repeat protein